MGKVKKTGAQHYEMLFIVPNKFTEEEALGILEKTKGIITDNGGQITYEEKWGKKKMAYPIDNNNHGYYYVVEFDSERSQVARMENLIKMSSDVLRHMIVSKKVESEEEKESKKKIAEKIAAKNLEKKEEEEKEEAEEDVKEKKEEKKKVDLEDLDDKLDKILDTGDLL